MLKCVSRIIEISFSTRKEHNALVTNVKEVLVKSPVCDRTVVHTPLKQLTLLNVHFTLSIEMRKAIGSLSKCLYLSETGNYMSMEPVKKRPILESANEQGCVTKVHHQVTIS